MLAWLRKLTYKSAADLGIFNMSPFCGLPELTDDELKSLFKGKCPDCGSDKWYEGPSGGICTNWECANDKCGSKFNIGGGLVGDSAFSLKPHPESQSVMLAQRLTAKKETSNAA